WEGNTDIRFLVLVPKNDFTSKVSFCPWDRNGTWCCQWVPRHSGLWSTDERDCRVASAEYRSHHLHNAGEPLVRSLLRDAAAISLGARNSWNSRRLSGQCFQSIG